MQDDSESFSYISVRCESIYNHVIGLPALLLPPSHKLALSAHVLTYLYLVFVYLLKLSKKINLPIQSNQVLELDPGSAWAQGAISRLEPLVQEKNEKLKNEMFGKLKVRSV